MANTSQEFHYIHPDGIAMGTLVITIFFTITTIAVLALRVYARTRHGLNGLEDYLMYIGGFLNLGHNIIVMRATFTGLGIPDDRLTLAQMMEAAKMVTIWQLFYINCSPFIKISICHTLIRIAMQRRYIYTLHAISAVLVASSIMAIIAVFIQCRPFEASWTGQGECISVNVIIIPTYVFSALNIAADWIVSIMPIFILWNLQIRRKLKMISAGILGIGILASIATIVRMVYIPDYAAKTNKLLKVCYILFWTVVELSLAIMAGSLPALRKLFKSLAKDESTKDSNSHATDLVTIGRIGNKSRSRQGDPFECELETIVDGRKDNGKDRTSVEDDDSTRRIIHVTRDVTQTYN